MIKRKTKAKNTNTIRVFGFMLCKRTNVNKLAERELKETKITLSLSNSKWCTSKRLKNFAIVLKIRTVPIISKGLSFNKRRTGVKKAADILQLK